MVFALVTLLAVAGAVDGALTLGLAAAGRLRPGSILGYLPTSLVFLGGGLGATIGAILGIEAQRHRRRVRLLPAYAVSLVAAEVIALALTWLLQQAVRPGSRLAVAIVALLLVALSAALVASRLQAEAAPRRPTMTVILRLASGALLVMAAFLIWIAYLLGVAISTFS
jgi:hypothetical protein